MLQFGFLISVLGLFELWQMHYVLGLLTLGGGLMMLSSRKVPLDSKVTWQNLFTPVDDSTVTNTWEKTARLLSTIAFAGGAAAGLAKLFI